MTIKNLEEKGLKIKTEQILLGWLNDKYFSEFEILDGLSRHPKGFNFYEWLTHNEYVEYTK